MEENTAGLPSKEYICNLQACNIELILGIEVDPTAGAKTCGLFELGYPGESYDPFRGFKTMVSRKSTQEGNLHITGLDFKELGWRTVHIQAGKSNVLSKYDKKIGKVSFKDSIYPTEEMMAEIYVFKDAKCLTGSDKFEDVEKKMNKTRTGVNRILIRLDDKGTKIQDCIIDGVVFMKDGNQKVQTAR